MGLEEADQVAASPNLTWRIALVFLMVFNITLALALLFDAPLGAPANPAVTPNPAKAPWYFVWLQELVASTTIRFGRFTISGGLLGGVLVPAVLLMLLIAWPFLDRSDRTSEGVWFAKARTRQNVAFALISLAIVALIFVGAFLRGPYWRLYWPTSPRPLMPQVF